MNNKKHPIPALIKVVLPALIFLMIMDKMEPFLEVLLKAMNSKKHLITVINTVLLVLVFLQIIMLVSPHYLSNLQIIHLSLSRLLPRLLHENSVPIVKILLAHLHYLQILMNRTYQIKLLVEEACHL